MRISGLSGKPRRLPAAFELLSSPIPAYATASRNCGLEHSSQEIWLWLPKTPYALRRLWLHPFSRGLDS